MSDDRHTSTRDDEPPAPIPFPTARRRRVLDRFRRGRGGGAPGRPKLKKLRLMLVLTGLGVLALVSTAFGMLMAVAADLPKLENRQEFHNAQNSQLLDIHGKRIGLLTGHDNRILVPGDQISPYMKDAIISVEDRRFFQNDGIDLHGLLRAVSADFLSQQTVQGGSTITEQFVKNALAAQGDRTIFEKVREAALAYHLTKQWSKPKILTEYLNSIYFGNGAYGVEAAARTYFGRAHPGCGEPGHAQCSSVLTPAEAALIAGVVSSPSTYDPVDHPQAALRRRNVVLRLMRAQHALTPSQYQAAVNQGLPAPRDIHPPEELSAAPYFTSWVEQQVIGRFGATRAFDGGLKIRTTLDLELQHAAQQAVRAHVDGPGQPSAALVVLDNKTGQVRALVGGKDYGAHPFNLATQGQRQPGSAFKPFTLAVALREGISPDSVWASKRKVINDPAGHDKFVVNNYEGDYLGQTTLANALTVSDNSVFAEVGVKVGVAKIADLAEAMGIRTPVSHNYAITLGGLHEGVTPLDLAHAYETFATHGQRISGSILGRGASGPVGIAEVRDRHDHVVARNHPVRTRVLPADVADTATSIMETVVSSGTGQAAAIPGFVAGKTGTTENYADAWFVGFNHQYTVAVWVGYPNRLRSMRTQFHGGPVAGGTFPAEIWHDFMSEAQRIEAQRTGKPIQPVSPAPTTPAPTSTYTAPTPTYTAPPATTTTPTYTAPTPTYTAPAYTSPSTTPSYSPPSSTSPSGTSTGGSG